MMMTDPIADLLTRIRNAGQAGHRWADMPVSKLKVEIARILKENHYVFDYKVLDDGRHGVLRIYLKYHEGQPVIRHLQRVSTPGRRQYVGAQDIPKVRNGLGMAILSTSQGVLSDRGARSEGVGGELLALVW
ncbi:MAG: 30S ribosomal protein S8 [Gemmatimonadales bacterium]|nr:MAG: 30S ribosomal protein S8 [Gemmatimonadales bacterium]